MPIFREIIVCEFDVSLLTIDCKQEIYAESELTSKNNQWSLIRLDVLNRILTKHNTKPHTEMINAYCKLCTQENGWTSRYVICRRFGYNESL